MKEERLRHIIILLFYFSNLSISASSFNCSVCKEKTSWKKLPEAWNDGTEKRGYMAFDGHQINGTHWEMVIIGGTNIDGLPINSPAYIQFSFNSNNVISTKFGAQLFPSIGHTLVAYKGCIGCSKNSAYDGKNAYFMYGGAKVDSNNETALISPSELIIVPTGTSVSVYQLNTTSPFPPLRFFHTCVYTVYYAVSSNLQSPGSMIVFGGLVINQIEEKYYNDVWVFQLHSESWVKLTTSTAPANRSHHAAAMWGNKMYIHGGKDNDEIFDDFWVLNLDDNTWTRLNPNYGNISPSKRFEHTLVALDGRSLILTGGYNDFGIYSDVYEYNIDLNIWTQHCSTGDPKKRYGAAGFLVGPSQFLLGGGAFAEKDPKTQKIINQNFLDFFVYDADERRDEKVICSDCTEIKLCRGYKNNEILSVSYLTQNPFFCEDNLGVVNYQPNPSIPCPNNYCDSLKPIKCWYGACVESMDQCIPFPRCPIGKQRCSNGACADSCAINTLTCDCDRTMQCKPTCSLTRDYRNCCVKFDINTCCNQSSICSFNKSLCIHGCQLNQQTPCPSYDGCLYPKYQCPDGSCADSISQCSNFINYNCTGVSCPDNSCANSCNSTPIYWKKAKQTSDILFRAVQSPLPLELKSLDNSTLGLIKLVSTSQVGYFVVNHTIPESVLRTIKLYNKWSIYKRGYPVRTQYYANIFSTIITLTISGNYSTLTLYPDYSISTEIFMNDSCLAYIDKNQNWICLEDTYPGGSGFDKYTVSNKIWYGLGININAFQFPKCSPLVCGTFAIIRKKWPLPTQSQIFNDIENNLSLSSWQLIPGVIKVKVEGSSVILTLQQPPDNGTLDSNINKINDIFINNYGLLKSQIQINRSNEIYNISFYDTPIIIVPVTPPTPTTNQTQSPQEAKDEDLDAVIIGASVASVIAIALFIALLYFYIRSTGGKKSKQDNKSAYQKSHRINKPNYGREDRNYAGRNKERLLEDEEMQDLEERQPSTGFILTPEMYSKAQGIVSIEDNGIQSESTNYHKFNDSEIV